LDQLTQLRAGDIPYVAFGKEYQDA